MARWRGLLPVELLHPELSRGELLAEASREGQMRGSGGGRAGGGGPWFSSWSFCEASSASGRGGVTVEERGKATSVSAVSTGTPTLTWTRAVDLT